MGICDLKNAITNGHCKEDRVGELMLSGVISGDEECDAGHWGHGFSSCLSSLRCCHVSNTLECPKHEEC